jgi:CheY-like chemotaxis protein
MRHAKPHKGAQIPLPGQAVPTDDAHRNSINLDAAALKALMKERDAANKQSKGALNREFVRWPFQVTTVKLVLIHPGGTPSTIHVACGNLSAGGIGVLHRTYVHKGTRCTVTLPKVDGTSAELEGTVVRCIHVQGTIHDVGIQFSTPVVAKDFVRLDPFADGFSIEKVDPSELKGTVLYIEDSQLDQALVRHFLNETQLRIQFASTKAEALEKAYEAIDLILCDYILGDDSGADVVSALRSAGITIPIIMLTSDTSRATREKLIRAQADAFISKPLHKEMLQRAIAEFIVVNEPSGYLHSSLAPDHPHRPLVPVFIEQVKEYSATLRRAMKHGNADKARAVCLQIAGSAPTLGFAKLALLAQRAEVALSTSMEIQDAIAPLRVLAAACESVASRGG